MNWAKNYTGKGYNNNFGRFGRMAQIPMLLPYYASSGQFRQVWGKLMKDVGFTKDNWLYSALYEMRSIKAIDRPFHELRRLRNQAVDSFRQNTCLLYTSPSPRD